MAQSTTMSGFSPTSGPVGTVVTITGTGFTSSAVVKFNGLPAARPTASSHGTKLKATVPALATSGPITVSDASGTTGLPGTAFQVTRGVSATRNVWPGGNVIVSGSALSPNREDPIRVGDRQLGTAITDAFGDFQVGVTMPFDATPGRTGLTVVDPAGNLLAIINVLVSWPQERHDEGGTGDDLLEQALNTSNAPSLTQHWATFCCASTGVAVAGGLVFVGYVVPQQWDNLVGISAYKVGTGALAWVHLVTADSGTGSTPAVANGVVYGADVFRVFALKADTGALLWTAGLPNLGSSSPTVAGGVVYISSNGLLDAFDGTTGALLWSKQPGTNTGLGSTPAVQLGGSVSGGEVLVGEPDGNLYAFGASTGGLLWSKPGGGGSQPAISGNSVYVGASNGTLYARDVANGALAWKYAVGGALYPPAVDGSTVYVTSTAGKVVALNSSTGALRWSESFAAPATVPAVANGVVYFGTTAGRMQALNASTGTGLGNVTPANKHLDPRGPAVANGIVYFTAHTDFPDGYPPTVYAYGL